MQTHRLPTAGVVTRRAPMKNQPARAAWCGLLTTVCALIAFESRAQELSFFGRRDYAVRREPTSIAIADFNGDGIPDLAVAGWVISPSYQVENSGISLLLGRGDGTFEPARNFDAGR